MHMAAARLGSKEAMLGTGWASGCMNGLRKHYSQFLEGSFLAGKAIFVLKWCLLARNADYCMLVMSGHG